MDLEQEEVIAESPQGEGGADCGDDEAVPGDGDKEDNEQKEGCNNLKNTNVNHTSFVKPPLLRGCRWEEEQEAPQGPRCHSHTEEGLTRA